MISTGDVAAFGTKDTIGAKNKQIKNNTPVVTAVKPVRPPAPTPAALSSKGSNCRSTEQCTSTNADSIDSHSFTKTWDLPDLGSAIFASVAVPIKVPMESNNSTKGEGER